MLVALLVLVMVASAGLVTALARRLTRAVAELGASVHRADALHEAGAALEDALIRARDRLASVRDSAPLRPDR